MRFLACVFISFACSQSIQAQGVDFLQNFSWTEVLDRARVSKRMIFVDAYTSWCVPCRQMNQQVFPDPEVSSFFNRNFVNVKLDMEKGEGPALAKRYGVEVYPTLLFINPDGTVAHRAAGYHKPQDLLDLAAQALDPTRNLQQLDEAYQAGDRTPAFLRSYLQAKSSANESGLDRLANEFLRNAPDWNSDDAMEVIFRHVTDPYDEPFKFLVRNRTVFETRFSPEAVRERLDYVFTSYLQRHPNLPLGEIQRLIGAVYPNDSGRASSAYRITYFYQLEELDKFAEAAIDHFERYPSKDPDELGQTAWMFCQSFDDKERLEVALTWALQAVALQNNFSNCDLTALIYYKLGKKKQAAKYATEAIERAKASGEDYSSSAELLKKL